MRHSRKEESLWRLYVERSDSTQICCEIGGTLVERWWKIGGHWWTIGTQNWWNLVFHGVNFFVVSTSSPPIVELVEHWWTTVGQIRGARIEKHFVQH